MASVAGAYTLTSVRGQAPPLVVAMGVDISTTEARVTRTLDADGTCRESGTYVSQRAGGGPAATLAGTALTCAWALAGRTVTFAKVAGQSWYDATTSATVTADGTLTEQTSGLTNGPGGPETYPQVYSR